MAYIRVRLDDCEYAKLKRRAGQEGVSPSTMLAFLLDRGDNHPKSAFRRPRSLFLQRGDNHLRRATASTPEDDKPTGRRNDLQEGGKHA